MGIELLLFFFLYFVYHQGHNKLQKQRVVKPEAILVLKVDSWPVTGYSFSLYHFEFIYQEKKSHKQN